MNTDEQVDYIYRFEANTLTVQKLVWCPGHIRRSTKHRLPIPVDDSLTDAQRRIFACLVHWLRDPKQARALVIPVAQVFPKKMAAESWAIDRDELGEAVILAFCACKKAVSGDAKVEYVGGQRRDTVRALMT